MKKNITVSNLTLDLYLDYVRPAALAAGILEETTNTEGLKIYVIEEAAAEEIANCMTVACFNANNNSEERTHEQYVENEARQMLYQMEVSIKYRHETAETMTALLAAMTDILTPAEEQTTDTEEEEEEKTMFNNYYEAVTEDAAKYIRDNYTAEELAKKLTDREEFWEELNDAMWIADEVTGNGSGSYTFDRAQAREYVLADIDTVREALREFCTPADTIAEKFLDEDWEYFDVTARCYVLGQVIEDAIDRAAA